MVSQERRAAQRESADTATVSHHLFSHGNCVYRIDSLKRKRPSHGVFQRTGSDASNMKFRVAAALGASAVVAVGAVVMGVNQVRNNLGTDASSGMSTGVTITEPVAPTIPPVIRATPGITGPAPLPPEEQGLPG